MSPLGSILMGMLAATMFAGAWGISQAMDKISNNRRTPKMEFWSGFGQMFMILGGIVIVLAVIIPFLLHLPNVQ